MPFAAVPPDHLPTRPAVVAFSGYRGLPYGGGLSLSFDVTRRSLNAIHFGVTTYHLRQPTHGAFSPSPTDATGEFLVEGFSRSIVGTGTTPDEAYRDWKTKFHATFQRLYVSRPFEMEEADRRTWNTIENMIDIEQYRAAQPLIVRQVGTVSKARPYPLVIRWEDGTQERVHLERMPGEFATYKAGQPFEAMVHRNPVTHKLIRVEFVKRLPGESLKRDESRNLWDSTPTSATLADTTWD